MNAGRSVRSGAYSPLHSRRSRGHKGCSQALRALRTPGRQETAPHHDGTTRAAHPQPPARRAHRRSGVLERGSRASRRPARTRTRPGPEIRQDVRHPVAAGPAAPRHHAGADRRGLHPAPRPPPQRPGPRSGRLRARLRGLEFAATPEEAVDIVGGLWRKDSGSHAELRKIAFTPAGLVVPSRDWLIGRPDEKVARAEVPVRIPAQGRPVTPRGPYRSTRPAAAPRPPSGAPARRSPAATSPRCARSANCSAAWTTGTAAGTPGRRSCATSSTSWSRCCAAPTASRPAAACSPPPPT